MLVVFWSGCLGFCVFLVVVMGSLNPTYYYYYYYYSVTLNEAKTSRPRPKLRGRGQIYEAKV